MTAAAPSADQRAEFDYLWSVAEPRVSPILDAVYAARAALADAVARGQSVVACISEHGPECDECACWHDTPGA